jgi:uncharacterized protein (DUF4415 family)
MTEKKNVSKTDWDKVDAYVLTEADYEEIPELTDEWFDRADFHIGGKLIRKGRPPKAEPKVPVSLRLSADVVAGFKSDGPGWQTRMNDALRDWLARKRA